MHRQKNFIKITNFINKSLFKHHKNKKKSSYIFKNRGDGFFSEKIESPKCPNILYTICVRKRSQDQ